MENKKYKQLTLFHVEQKALETFPTNDDREPMPGSGNILKKPLDAVPAGGIPVKKITYKQFKKNQNAGQ